MRDNESGIYDSIVERDSKDIVSEDIKTIAINVRNIRKKRKMTQRELAQKADISLGTLYKIEKGEHDNITFSQIRRIATALDVPISEIIKVDFYAEKMTAINRFMYYYPLLRECDLIKTFGETMDLCDADSIRYLERRLERVYESFPIKIRAFIELRILSNLSNSVSKKIKNDIIPEPYGRFISIDDYRMIEKRYNSLLEYKRQRSLITNPITYLENGD